RGDDVGYGPPLLLGRAVRAQPVEGAVREARVLPPGVAAGVQHLLERDADRHGQALSAVLGVAGQCRPAAGLELLPGLPETLRRRDHAAFGPAAAPLVARASQRKQHLRAELAAFLDDLVDQCTVGRGMSRRRLERSL